VQVHLSNSDRFSPLRQPATQQVKEQIGASSTSDNSGSIERSVSVPSNMVVGSQKFSSGSLIPEHVLSPYRNAAAETERYHLFALFLFFCVVHISNF
jgi:hypothetical protein